MLDGFVWVTENNLIRAILKHLNLDVEYVKEETRVIKREVSK